MASELKSGIRNCCGIVSWIVRLLIDCKWDSKWLVDFNAGETQLLAFEDSNMKV